MARRIGILTGGGDVPGLNMAIKVFVGRMEEAGYEVLGLKRGWDALLNVLPSPQADNSAWVVPLTRANTRTIDRSGGTVLHTSRINPAIMKPEEVPEHLRGREAWT
jgi:ATP-dependent phosphofructokinase / diphosphate-dependent phosphofructokinase